MTTTSTSTTGYARLTARQAGLVLAAWVALLVVCVGVTLSPLKSTRLGKPRTGQGDTALYRAEIARIRAGEGYYQAAAKELVARGYPTRSVFNWRPPLLTSLLARLPAGFAKAMLCGLARALIAASFEIVARECGVSADTLEKCQKRTVSFPVRPLACAVLLIGPLLECGLGDEFVSPDLWAGILIALSIVAYGLDRPWLGVACGLAALFVRELALLYVVFSAVLAWWEHRRGEWRAWMIGLAAWLVFFGLHAALVRGWIPPHAQAHREGWIQFGGLPFVISTMQMNAFLIVLPQWVTAVYFAAAMLGMAGWQGPLGRRAGMALSLYVVAFSIAGHDFNQYWGELIGPLACLGVVRAAASIRDLQRVIEGERGTSVPC